MTFNHQQYNAEYVVNAKNNAEPINDAEETYGVQIIEAEVAEGETYWKVIGVHHLLPRENFSNHHVYLEALDEDGVRIKNPFAWAGWTWEGRRPDERADPVAMDKPSTEPAGNIAMDFGQTVSVWLKGLSRDANDISDTVENLHTRHPDEPLSDGSLLNTLGHHSFYVVFQRTSKTTTTTNGVITGTVERGEGYTIQLLKNNVVTAEQVLGSDVTYRFENLSFGTYKLQVVGTSVSQDNVRIDADNQVVTINLALPVAAVSSIFGVIQNGFGKSLLLIKEDCIIARLTIPESGEYRFINLAAGIYSVEIFGTGVRQENIALDGTDSREINLTVPDAGEEPTEKSITHYLLFGPPGSRGRQTNLLLATDFILAFSITAGYSVTEAKQARQVTIIGEGISATDQEAIGNSGSAVEVLAGDAYEIEEELNARINSGNAFPSG